jgi:hypothetical protein
MTYKRLPNIDFPWTYDELLKLPIFMKDHVYRIMDEFIDEEQKHIDKLQKKIGGNNAFA